MFEIQQIRVELEREADGRMLASVPNGNSVSHWAAGYITSKFTGGVSRLCSVARITVPSRPWLDGGTRRQRPTSRDARIPR